MTRWRAAATVLAMVLLTGCARLGVPEEDGPAAAPTPVEEESSAAATPVPTDSPTENPTFVADSFSDQFSGWDVVEPGKSTAGEIMGYRDEGYFMAVRPPTPGFLSAAPIAGDAPHGDVAVQAEVQLARGRGHAGVFCRGAADLSPPSHAYLGGIDTDGSYGILRVGGSASRLLTEPGVTDPALRRTDRRNTVRLECIGIEDDTTLRLYINDTLVTEIVDPAPLAPSGEVGLFAIATLRRGSFDAAFDNFVAERQAASI